MKWFFPGVRSQYRRRGFHVFRDVLPVAQVDELATLARGMMPAYPGECLRHSGRAETNDFFPGTSLIRNSPLDLHLPLSSDLRPLSAALQALCTSPALADRLRQLDGARHYHITESLLFFAAQTTTLHLDSWGLDTVPHGGAHTLWIPLQDLDVRSGVPAVIPWPVGKVITEAELGLSSARPQGERYRAYHCALAARLLERGPEVATALARRGDLMVWSSLTPHFTLPAQPFPAERLSLQVRVRPAHLKWGSFTVQPDDHPTTRVMPATDRFSYFIHEDTHRQFGIGEILP
jgi:hypothetical protein